MPLPRLARGWSALLLPALLLLPAVVVAQANLLNGDVEYAVGGIETAGAAGLAPQDVFVARPVGYRLLVWALAQPAAALGLAPSSVPAEVLFRLGACLVAIAAGVLLYLGLRDRLGRPRAAAVTIAVTAALMAPPPWHFAQPDWAGVTLAVAGLGLALVALPAWAATALAGAAFTLALGAKIAALPWIVLALVAVAALNRGRSLAAAGWTAAMSLLGWISLRTYLPWELTWLGDQVHLVQSSPLHNGLRLEDLVALASACANAAVLSPILLVAPAAVVTLACTERRGWALLGTVLLGLSLGSAYGQGEFFQYHFVGAPALAAALWALALTGPGPRRALGAGPFVRTALAGGLLALPAVASVAAYVVLAQPLQWRLDRGPAIGWTSLGVAVGGAIWTWLVLREQTARRAGREWSAALGTVLALALGTASIPGAAYAVDGYDAPVVVRIGQPLKPDALAERDALVARMGADTQVLYLAFGVIAHAVGNPTPCRYPSPMWLQRGISWTYVRDYASYADNLRCLDDPRPAWVIVQPGWFDLARADQAVTRRVAETFDCSSASRLWLPALGVYACPRR